MGKERPGPERQKTDPGIPGLAQERQGAWSLPRNDGPLISITASRGLRV